jgi:hypothetical protein
MAKTRDTPGGDGQPEMTDLSGKKSRNNGFFCTNN